MSKLSVEKFNKYIAEHKFILSGVYTLKKNIRFFEMKTPNTRKTFFVFVPENFILTEERLVDVPTKFDMRRKDYTLSENFIKYINSTLTDDFDLVTISSTMLCHIPTMDVKDTTTYSFNLGDETYETDYDSDGESSKSSRSSSSSMSSVKKHTSHIEQLIKESGLPDSAFNDSDDEHKKNDDEQTPVKETETHHKRDGDDDDALTIISDTPKQDEEGKEKSDDDVSSSSSSSSDSIHSMEIDFDAPSRPEKKGVDKDEVDQIKKTKIITDIPIDIEEQQIRLGLVYYCCNISYFVSKISMIEVEVEKCWKLSDEIRKNTWTNSIDQIKTKVSKLSETLVTNINTNIEKYFLTQKNMSKLSVLYIKSFDDASSQQTPTPEKLQFQERTRQALDDVNITLVHIRNSIENEFEKMNSLIDEITSSANPR
jgi:hypothetical protein